MRPAAARRGHRLPQSRRAACARRLPVDDAWTGWQADLRDQQKQAGGSQHCGGAHVRVPVMLSKAPDRRTPYSRKRSSPGWPEARQGFREAWWIEPDRQSRCAIPKDAANGSAHPGLILRDRRGSQLPRPAMIALSKVRSRPGCPSPAGQCPDGVGLAVPDMPFGSPGMGPKSEREARGETYLAD